MTTSVREAGTAAPTPAAAELPSYLLTSCGDQIEVEAVRVRPDLPGVQLTVDALAVVTSLVLHPSQARLLAVYLVDCANALDNPAQRVIVDEGEPETARHMCSECNVLTDCPNGAGEGLGHE